MTDDELLDDILDEVEALGRQMAGDALARLFEERARGIPVGAPGRAAWLSHAGERWEMEGELVRARTCYEQAAQDGGAAYLDPRAELVNVLLELGETSRVDELLADIRRDLRAGWSGRFVHETVGEALEMHGRPKEALRWYSAGLTHAENLDPGAVDIGCLNGRYRVRRVLGLPQDRYDLMAEERRREYAADVAEDEGRLLDVPTATEPSMMTVLYWPETELGAVLDRWPSLAEVQGADHAEHRWVVEHKLRALSAHRGPLAVSTGNLQEYLTFAADGDHDPGESSTRAAYAAHLGYLGRVVAWPPGGDERCWCGSGLTYEACCGALR